MRDTGVAAYFRCCKAHRLTRAECSRAHLLPHSPCMWVQRICASWQHAMSDRDANESKLQQFMAGAIAQTMNRRTVPSMGNFFISWIQGPTLSTSDANCYSSLKLSVYEPRAHRL